MIQEEVNSLSYDLACFIRQERSRRHLTQMGLAQISRIDYKHVQLLESLTNKKDPRLSTLVKLARGLQVPVQDLLSASARISPSQVA